MSKPEYQWCSPIEIEAGRTCTIQFTLYKPNKRPAAIDSAAVLRFKLALHADDQTPALDIDSVAPLDGGSIVTIVSRGTDEVEPAQAEVRFAQADTAKLGVGDYFGEIGVVDTADGDAFKRSGYGTVTVKPAPGGDVGRM